MREQNRKTVVLCDVHGCLFKAKNGLPHRAQVPLGEKHLPSLNNSDLLAKSMIHFENFDLAKYQEKEIFWSRIEQTLLGGILKGSDQQTFLEQFLAQRQRQQDREEEMFQNYEVNQDFVQGLQLLTELNCENRVFSAMPVDDAEILVKKMAEINLLDYIQPYVSAFLRFDIDEHSSIGKMRVAAYFHGLGRNIIGFEDDPCTLAGLSSIGPMELYTPTKRSEYEEVLTTLPPVIQQGQRGRIHFETTPLNAVEDILKTMAGYPAFLQNANSKNGERLKFL